jgi:hypothetical protein
MAPHRLARVIDNAIQTIAGHHQFMAERLHARRMAQIETEDLQSMAPFLEIRLSSITGSGVPRKTRGHNERRTGPQQFDSGLIADLHASPGEQSHTAMQIGRFRPFEEIEFRT